MPRQPSPAPRSFGAAPCSFGAAPASREALLDAARLALASGDPARTRALLAQPLRQRPDDPALLAYAGLAQRALGDLLGALDLLERAVAFAPDLAPVRLALAEALIDAHRAPRALIMLDALPRSVQRSTAALLARAAALGALGDQPGEIKALRRLLTADRDHIAARLRLGHALRATGDAVAAETHYRSLVRRQPATGAAWWSLADLKSARLDEADCAAMRAVLHTGTLDRDDRVRILFALARAADAERHDEPAFALYAAANALRAQGSTYDRATVAAQVEASAGLFTPAFFTARRDHGSRSTAPIFIVGMQRSGSTLVEQMLSCHPDIEGTAELPHINQIVREVRRDARRAGLGFEQYLAALDPAATRALGDDYLARAAAHRHSDRPMFVDKFPNNWAHAGFIRLILPEARIIDVRRDPMACGWSNFRTLYAVGLEHSYALADWAHFYLLYADFMSRLGAAQPGAIHAVSYEALIDAPEHGLRAICAYLAIGYDPAMLDFHRSRRTVRTISAEQVRQPLHRGALDDWRRFEQWLAPLREALDGAPAAADRQEG